ncbi:MAG: hypothetical protein QGF53_05940 [Alphaproteobacteria bacterium]|nr:hypothetical protein [Alphaproteobacteria bacterium]
MDIAEAVIGFGTIRRRGDDGFEFRDRFLVFPGIDRRLRVCQVDFRRRRPFDRRYDRGHVVRRRGTRRDKDENPKRCP